MSIPKKYYWKDNNNHVRSSMGIELEDWEKGELARKNNKLIQEQLWDKQNAKEER